tara:strand:+ start:195 stop:389 length:195 start_codon:yes stop_codon:yes gene_type:complete
MRSQPTAMLYVSAALLLCATVAAQVPLGCTPVDPTSIPKYVDELLPPILAKSDGYVNIDGQVSK